MPVTPPLPAEIADAHGSNLHLVRTLRAEIAANGPLSLARFMDVALYDPEHGYYTTATRRPGRSGDFLTAPETHPFFGFTIARQVAECWERLGRPAPFVIREYGPGMGTLAYDILVALTTDHPDLAAVVHYRLCDLNAHRMTDALAAMEEVGFGAIVTGESPEEATTSPIVGVVLANEVADALPCHQVAIRDGMLRERFITWDDATGWFAWTESDLSPALAEDNPVARLAGEGVSVTDLPDGSLLEICPAATDWIGEVAAGLERGYAFVIDYGYPAAELYSGHRLSGLLRGYRDHAVTDDPLTAIGDQDLTAHVNFTQLINAAATQGLAIAGLTTQGDTLAALGLGDYLVALQRQDDASLEEYYQAQMAVMRLIDPAGLGRFRVLGLAKDAPILPTLRSFASPW